MLAYDLPFPLALVIREYISEENPFVKLHRLTDGTELLTRFAAMVVLSDVLRRRGAFPDTLRKALAEKIERPTFGAWKDLLKLACNELPKQKRGTECFIPELPAYVQKHLLPALGVNEGDASKQIIALRNILAHQGRLGDASAQEFLSYHQQAFETLLTELDFLTKYDLIACAADARALSLRGFPRPDGSFPSYKLTQTSQALQPERVALIHEAEWLDMFPLQAFGDVFQWREEKMERVADAVPQLYFRLSKKGHLEFTPLTNRAAFAQQRGAALDRFRELFRLEE